MSMDPGWTDPARLHLGHRADIGAVDDGPGTDAGPVPQRRASDLRVLADLDPVVDVGVHEVRSGTDLDVPAQPNVASDRDEALVQLLLQGLAGPLVRQLQRLRRDPDAAPGIE